MNFPATTSFERNNLTMLTDFYEITMANGFFETGVCGKIRIQIFPPRLT